MTSLGIFHTLVSVVALLVAFIALFRQGAIAPYSSIGKAYSGLTVVACATSFGIFKTGKFSDGHTIAIIILVLLALVYLFFRQETWIQTLCMSLTVFFSCVPAIAETLTRLPVGAPLAPNMDSPLIKMSIGTLFSLFLLGYTFQFFRLKKK